MDEREASGSAFGRWVAETVRAGGGPIGWAVRPDDLDASAARLGLDIADGSRTTPAGERIEWRSAGIEEAARRPWLPFFIEWGDPASFPGKTAFARRGHRARRARRRRRRAVRLARCRLPSHRGAARCRRSDRARARGCERRLDARAPLRFLARLGAGPARARGLLRRLGLLLRRRDARLERLHEVDDGRDLDRLGCDDLLAAHLRLE